VTSILSLADASDRRLAAAATIHGAALFYGFGNFCALAALPSRSSVERVNRLKGRPPGQAGSVTSDPSRSQLPFDWERLPRGLTPETVMAVMDDFHSLGPIGLRGPAARWVPAHLTVRDAHVRTVQHISPGVRCRSNALVADVLDRTGEELLFITSANASSRRTGQAEAAHFEMAAIAREFGQLPGVVMIGHDDEEKVRAGYRQYLPCSTSIVSFHRSLGTPGRPALLLERLGSLGVAETRTVVARHGLDLVVAPSARVPVPVRGEAALRAA
jgi:hypothetical protein